jgi:tRNA-2-methylthio-N6-dimethylallyladenosine synthase
VKRRRNNELLAVQGEICAANNRAMVGRTVEVMVEGESKLASKQAAYPANAPGTIELKWERKRTASPAAATQLIGRTRGDQVVAFDGDSGLKGRLMDVEIVDARNLTLFGRRVGVGATT